jgi:proteasome lid subunit RPN8/RPN11
VFHVSSQAFSEIIGRSLDEYPLEACGLLAGHPTADGGPGASGVAFFPCRNTDQSARVYTIDPRDHLAAERACDERGWEINAVVHSHTHSEPYPSPTDVVAAPDPSWHYIIVSLKREAPEIRSYRIVDGRITSEQLVVG